MVFSFQSAWAVLTSSSWWTPQIACCRLLGSSWNPVSKCKPPPHPLPPNKTGIMQQKHKFGSKLFCWIQGFSFDRSSPSVSRLPAYGQCDHVTIFLIPCSKWTLDTENVSLKPLWILYIVKEYYSCNISKGTWDIHCLPFLGDHC